jgi:hypothetical protein
MWRGTEQGGFDEQNVRLRFFERGYRLLVQKENFIKKCVEGYGDSLTRRRRPDNATQTARKGYPHVESRISWPIRVECTGILPRLLRSADPGHQ